MKVSAARIARAHARREDRMRQTLARLREWPDGMPPLHAMGSGIGTLVSLERAGLVRRLERDVLGDLRFVLTPEGERAAEEMPS